MGQTKVAGKPKEGCKGEQKKVRSMKSSADLTFEHRFQNWGLEPNRQGLP